MMSTSRAWKSLVLLVLLGGGCHLVFPFASRQGGAPEAGVADLARDVATDKASDGDEPTAADGPPGSTCSIILDKKTTSLQLFDFEVIVDTQGKKEVLAVGQENDKGVIILVKDLDSPTVEQLPVFPSVLVGIRAGGNNFVAVSSDGWLLLGKTENGLAVEFQLHHQRDEEVTVHRLDVASTPGGPQAWITGQVTLPEPKIEGRLWHCTELSQSPPKCSSLPPPPNVPSWPPLFGVRAVMNSTNDLAMVAVGGSNGFFAFQADGSWKTASSLPCPSNLSSATLQALSDPSERTYVVGNMMGSEQPTNMAKLAYVERPSSICNIADNPQDPSPQFFWDVAHLKGDQYTVLVAGEGGIWWGHLSPPFSSSPWALQPVVLPVEVSGRTFRALRVDDDGFFAAGAGVILRCELPGPTSSAR